MKYKGIKLKEVTEPQIFDPPKDMLVWDDDDESRELSQASVCAIVKHRKYTVITVSGYYQHCAYCPKSKPVTNRELARWLSEGNGEAMWANAVRSNWNYSNDDETKALDESLYVRKWDDTGWRKPTREYLGLEG